MAKVIGLDLSLKATGVCIVDGDNICRIIHTEKIIGKTAKGVKEVVDRLIAISNMIISIIDCELPDAIIIEAPAMNQKWQASQMGELHGVVKADIIRKTNHIPMVEQATKMRKAVVGKIESKRSVYKDKNGNKKSKVDYGAVPSKVGKSGKMKRATIKDIIEIRLRDQQGMVFQSQDEMDAYVTARFGWNMLTSKGI